MKIWPGGDAYFGALLNSMIHVMMYSYYTLSLLKITCPWKKYLTQSQLLQFCTVVGYTLASTIMHYRKGEAESRHYWCLGVQSFEMVSLFFLFMHFYSKTYKAKKQSGAKAASSSGSQDGSETVPDEASTSSETSDEAKKQR
jgi:elongation of very long chain fatty acids protein 4